MEATMVAPVGRHVLKLDCGDGKSAELYYPTADERDEAFYQMWMSRSDVPVEQVWPADA